MKLIKVLNIVNQIEKSSFLKIIDGLCMELRDSIPQVDKILSESDGQLKNVDNANIVRLFHLFKEKYSSHLQEKLKFNEHQLDVLTGILIRDGNSLVSG